MEDNFSPDIDPLTGLKNRQAFVELLNKELDHASNCETSLTLLLIDVDRLKNYMDFFGHYPGDDVLINVSNCLRSVIGELYASGIIARYGGDEFGVILPGADRVTARQIAEQIRLAVESFPNKNRIVTVSIGLAIYTRSTESWIALCSRANTALEEAKRAGRNGVVEFNA